MSEKMFDKFESPRFERSDESAIETEREREPLAVVEIDLARHSFKGKKDGREPITAAGMEAAASKGRTGDHYHKVIDKVNQGKVLEIFGSPLERTSQSSLLRMLGKHFEGVNFADLDPQGLVDWIDARGNLKKTESPLLDFNFGDGKFKEEALKAANGGYMLDWYSQKSDALAIETKQDPKKVSTFSTLASNVTGFILALGSKKTEQLATSKEKSDFAFATSHMGVLESFLCKVILNKEGEQAAYKFIESLSKQGFSENQGFKAYFRKYSDKPEDFDVLIGYEGKNYEVTAKELVKIINDGIDLKAKMAKARKGNE